MKKQAFTLVELIVVITILAILSTISFITLSGYSKEARDSKRITDTSSILSKINIEFVKGEKLSNLIIKDKDNNLTIRSSSNPGFQGVPNYEILKEDYKNFRDPTNNQIYPFAYTIGGTGSGAHTFMQMATVSESEGRARLMGNYFKFDNNDSPSLFTSSGTTGINIPADYLEDNGIELPYNIGMQVAPLVCSTGYQEINNRCVAIVCGTGKYLEGNECKDIICPTGKYLDGNDCKDIICPVGKYLVGNDCIDQWGGDAANGYIFKTSTGVIVYPTSCNNLLTDNQFKIGTTGAYNGTKFLDGMYYIKPDSGTAYNVYCDMTSNGGGWLRISYNYSQGPCSGMSCGSTLEKTLISRLPSFTLIKGLKQTQSGSSCGSDQAKVYLNGGLCSCSGTCYNHSYSNAIFNCTGLYNSSSNILKQYGYLSCTSSAPRIWVGTENGYIYIK